MRPITGVTVRNLILAFTLGHCCMEDRLEEHPHAPYPLCGFHLLSARQPLIPQPDHSAIPEPVLEAGITDLPIRCCSLGWHWLSVDVRSFYPRYLSSHVFAFLNPLTYRVTLQGLAALQQTQQPDFLHFGNPFLPNMQNATGDITSPAAPEYPCHPP